MGKEKDDVIGRKCYEVIQGRDSPCPFCTNRFLTEDKFYEWEYNNPILGRKFLSKNRIIRWEGHRARIELSHDMYSTEYKLAKKDLERENLLRTIPGGFVRLDARKNGKVIWYGAGGTAFEIPLSSPRRLTKDREEQFRISYLRIN